VRRSLNPDAAPNVALTPPRRRNARRSDEGGTAADFHYDGTLPIDRSDPVSLEVGGRSLGEFFVESLRCAERQYADDPMYLTLRASKALGPSGFATKAHEDEPDREG